MHIRTKKSVATFVLLAGTALGATTVMATPTTSATDITATSAPATLNAEQQQIQQADALAQNGRQAMSYIVAARQLLTEKQGDEAHEYLEHAKDLLTKLKSRVVAGKQNTPDLLPVYAQLGIKEGVELTDQIKQQLGKTHLNAVRGNHQEVVEALRAVDIEMQYSFVDMPIAATLGQVESALKSLSEKDTKQADQALAAAQNGLIRDSIVINAVDINPAG